MGQYVKLWSACAEHLFIEGFGCSFWNGQRNPILAFYHFAHEDNLAHMVGVMCQLAVDGLDNGVVPAPYADVVLEIG